MLMNYASIPTTVPDIEQRYCALLDERLKCVFASKDCFTGFARHVFTILLNGVSKHFSSYCKDRAGMERAIYEEECIVGLDTQSLIQKYNDEITRMLAYAKNISDGELIPKVCCMYSYVNQRITALTTEVCKERVDRDFGRLHFIGHALDSAAGELVELLCPATHKSFNKCKEVEPSVVADLDAITSKVIEQKTNKTFLFALAEFGVTAARLFD